MGKTERIAMALKFLERTGYVLHATSPKRGIDLIVFKKGDPNTAIFVAVMPAKPRTTIQIFKNKQGQNSLYGLFRLHALMASACKRIEEVAWLGASRFDSVIIHDTSGRIDHIENAGGAKGAKSVVHAAYGNLTITAEC